MNWEDVVNSLQGLDFTALLDRAREVPVAPVGAAVILLVLVVWLWRRRRRRVAERQATTSETREAVLRELQTLNRREGLHAVAEPAHPGAAPSPQPSPPPVRPVEPPPIRLSSRDEPLDPITGAPEVLERAGLRSEIAQLRAAHAVMKEELRALHDEVRALKAGPPRPVSAPQAKEPPVPPAAAPPRPVPPPAMDAAPPEIPLPGSRESRLSGLSDEDPSVRRARAAIEALEREERENN